MIKLKDGTLIDFDSRSVAKHELGEGYCVIYQQVRNGLGGYKAVNICLCRDKELVRQMTDENGLFLDFPGYEPGEWQEKAEFPLQPPAVRFAVHFPTYIKKELGAFTFGWMYQPDGRYYEDDDGFGADNDVEINLYAEFDKTGRFLTPFKP